MKKHNGIHKFGLLFVAVMLLSVFTASSQIRFGVKGGFDVAENKISKNVLNAHNRLGFQVGPTLGFNIPFTGLGINTGLLYGHKQYDVDNNDEGADVSDYNYLMVPIDLKKSFSLLGTLGIFVKGGPYGEFKLSGGDFKNDIGDKIKSKSFGMGLNFGLGVNLFSKLDVGMDYRFKLTDNYDDDKPSFGDYFSTRKDKTWNVYLTYYLK